MDYPRIIQAGMGIGVSNWVLANAVSRTGNLGVVSGTAIDSVSIRRLQDGDTGGHIRRAITKFPRSEIAEQILRRYYIEGGKGPTKPYAVTPMVFAKIPLFHQQLLVLANFVEVFLAKEGHDGQVGINYLEKVQMSILPSLYGAMLADVDYIIMGAGIPREIPGVLEKLTRHLDVDYKLTVTGAVSGDDYKLVFKPTEVLEGGLPDLKKPKFLAVVSSNTLAYMLTKKISPAVDGLIFEAPVAGGHNAPPRGKVQLNDRGEPIYSGRDQVDFVEVRKLGVPFWLAGARGSASSLKDALDQGACGIQVGTVFALCEESGLESGVKKLILQKVISGKLDVYTDPQASPTGFPFKVAALEGTNSDANIYQLRTRKCDLGYLREAYKKSDGSLGYRCPSEPQDAYVKKGGALENTIGRKCLCNGLMANIGLGQIQGTGDVERALVTLGDDVNSALPFVSNGHLSFTARDVTNELGSSVKV